VIVPVPVPLASGPTVIQGTLDLAVQPQFSVVVIETLPVSSAEETERLAGDITYLQATCGTASGFAAETEINREAITQNRAPMAHGGPIGLFI
jgi:hypothetical protein